MPINEVLMPDSLEKAKEALNTNENVKLLAGGTDLILAIRRGELEIQSLIDLSKIRSIRGIKSFEHHIILGSMTTFTDIKNSSLIKENCSAIKDCADMMGSPQIRNRATIGGNLANAAASADIIPCLMVMDGVLHIESSSSKRLIRCTDYFKDHKNNRIKENEILTEIIITKTSGTSGFYKLGKRNALAISRLCSAISLVVESNNIKDARIAIGSAGRFPYRVSEIETLLKGKDISYLFNKDVYIMLEERIAEEIKDRPTMPFKREAIKGVYKEAVKRALNRSKLVGEWVYE